jgi:YHS domain-containing protein
MSGSVPLGRRNLLADPRRLVAGAVGVGLAVMLMLLLDGLWSGIRTQSSLFEDRVGADLYVTQPGITSLLGGGSLLPTSTVDAVRSDPGVTWAAPVRGMAVERADNPQLQLDGRTWWFCSTHCRDEFAAQPARFPLLSEVATS